MYAGESYFVKQLTLTDGKKIAIVSYKINSAGFYFDHFHAPISYYIVLKSQKIFLDRFRFENYELCRFHLVRN